jgi:hypothetical protein
MNSLGVVVGSPVNPHLSADIVINAFYLHRLIILL